jgi:hypothetical protein
MCQNGQEPSAPQACVKTRLASLCRTTRDAKSTMTIIENSLNCGIERSVRILRGAVLHARPRNARQFRSLFVQFSGAVS